jgi:hypothetical protein
MVRRIRFIYRKSLVQCPRVAAKKDFNIVDYIIGACTMV